MRILFMVTTENFKYNINIRYGLWALQFQLVMEDLEERALSTSLV